MGLSPAMFIEDTQNLILTVLIKWNLELDPNKTFLNLANS
jgi:hypothetical protein